MGGVVFEWFLVGCGWKGEGGCCGRFVIKERGGYRG